MKAIRAGGVGWTAGIALACAFGGVALAAEDGCLAGASETRATRAPDARSLEIADGRVLRVAGIEPFDLLLPDMDDAAERLRQRLSELVGTGTLSFLLVSDGPDRYGRHPAMIAAGGMLVQESLAGEGLAVAFAGGDPLPCFDKILAAEEEARRRRLGFWREAAVPPATPEALAPLAGSFVIFEGGIVSVGNRSTRTYLNFGRRWSEDVTVEVEARDRRRFGGEEGLGALTGKRVRIRGFLEEKAGPMVAIRSPMQLEVLSAEGAEEEPQP